MKRIHKYRKWIFVIAVVVVIALLAPRLAGVSAEDILNYTPEYPLLAALVLIAIYCAKSVIIVIPTYGLYLAGGMLLPTGWAILVGFIGLAGELSLGFLTGRWLGREKVDAFIQKSPKARRFSTFLNSNSQTVCFVTRLLPMPYPVELGSMFFGASGMNFWRHLVFSLLGLSALMIPVTMAGGAISDPFSAEFIVPFAVSIGVSVVLFVAYWVWGKRRGALGEGAGVEEEDTE